MRRNGMLLIIAALLAAFSFTPVAGDEDVVRPIIRKPIRQFNGTPPPYDPQLSDEEALKKAGLSPTDSGPLIEYLKARTLTDVDQNKIGDVIKKFAADDFEERQKATEEVEKFGSAAIGPLKTAERDLDPEVAYRAKLALRRMEKVPHSAVAAAAVRTIVKLKPKEAAATLIAFLPMADSDEVAEEIRTALIALAVVDGKAEAAILKALDDKSVLRRAAAYVALIEGGPATERIRIKDAFPLVKDAVLKETDVDAKFRGLWAMLLTSREKEFVAPLIDMIPMLPRGRIWQLEEFLLQVAGDGKPADGRFGKSEEALRKAKSVWAAWWANHVEGFDLVKFAFKPRITGYTDIIEYDPNFGRSRLLTLGPDQMEKAKIGGTAASPISYASDVRKLANGNYLIAEQNGNRITERDLTGRIVRSTNVSQPVSVDVLPDGGFVVVCRSQVIAYDKDMTQAWQHTRQNDILCGRRMPNGDIVFITRWSGAANTTAHCHRLTKDGKEIMDGKEVRKPVAVGRANQPHSMSVAGDDKILICEYTRVVEFDLKTGKESWTHTVSNPSSVQRLPNGNTVIAGVYFGNSGRVIEVDTAGEVVWEYESKEGMRPQRAVRR